MLFVHTGLLKSIVMRAILIYAYKHRSHSILLLRKMFLREAEHIHAFFKRLISA